jgi:hypothetical protein
MDLLNARLEMRAIKQMAIDMMSNDAISKAVKSRLTTILAYADNELYRLDRLEKDIEEG